MQPADDVKIEGGNPKRTYKVLDDGRVQVHEIIEKTSTMSARDFRTFYFVESEKAIGSLKDMISEESIKERKENLKEVEEEMKTIKPILKDAEEKYRKIYEAKQKENEVRRLKEELAKPKNTWNKTYLYSIIEAFQKKDPDMISKMLNEEEQNKIMKLLVEKKTAERANKKRRK